VAALVNKAIASIKSEPPAFAGGSDLYVTAKGGKKPQSGSTLSSTISGIFNASRLLTLLNKLFIIAGRCLDKQDRHQFF
jgi:hypothetical protein